jgi:hypothetical protein
MVWLKAKSQKLKAEFRSYRRVEKAVKRGGAWRSNRSTIARGREGTERNVSAQVSSPRSGSRTWGTCTEYTKIAFQSSKFLITYLTSINNLGEMVGYAETGVQYRYFSYVQHKFSIIGIPGIPNAWTIGLNDEGALIGEYLDSSLSLVGFVYQNGSVQNIEFPGAAGMYLYSINDSGEVVGSFFDSDNIYHGFTWTAGGPHLRPIVRGVPHFSRSVRKVGLSRPPICGQKPVHPSHLPDPALPTIAVCPKV